MEQDSTVEPVERGRATADEDRGLSPLVKAAVVFVMLGGALALLILGPGRETLVYSKKVEEVMRQPTDFEGREVRVEGPLKEGSIQFSEKPCEYRFVLGKDGSEMPVRFPQCIVPDTFQDGMGIQVVVQGKLTEQGYFHAEQVIPRCPSKYEMKQKAANGEVAPHKMPTGLPLES